MRPRTARGALERSRGIGLLVRNLKVHGKVTANPKEYRLWRHHLDPSPRATRLERIGSACAGKVYDRSKYGSPMCVRALSRRQPICNRWRSPTVRKPRRIKTSSMRFPSTVTAKGERSLPSNFRNEPVRSVQIERGFCPLIRADSAGWMRGTLARLRACSTHYARA